MIRSGLGASRLNVTMADVAREAGVSRQLVSLVIRNTGYVSPARRERVLDAARRLGYRRNSLAANLASRRTNVIGFVVLDIRNEVYADLADGITEVLAPAGYTLLLALAAHGADALAGIDALTGLRVDGLLVATHVSPAADLASALAGTPTVILGETKEVPNVDAVRGDDHLGARLATQHLIDQGHRAITFVGGPDNQQHAARFGGYRAAMLDAGLAPRHIDGDATEQSGRDALVQMIRGPIRPSGVLCYNDATAFGVLDAAHRQRVDVPRDLAVIGYDDTRTAALAGVDLTSVDQHTPQIGAAAASLLLARLEDEDREPVTETITPRLVVRGSSIARDGRDARDGEH